MNWFSSRHLYCIEGPSVRVCMYVWAASDLHEVADALADTGWLGGDVEVAEGDEARLLVVVQKHHPLRIQQAKATINGRRHCHGHWTSSPSAIGICLQSNVSHQE
eukprot:scaffold207611_cov48-Prasinocladus_malaysianus.AAC.3